MNSVKYGYRKLHVLSPSSRPSMQPGSEDPDGSFLDSGDVPTGSRLAILQHSADGDDKPDDGAAAHVGSFKLLGWGRRHLL